MYDLDELIPLELDKETHACLKLWASKLEAHIKDFSKGPYDNEFYEHSNWWIFKDLDETVGSFTWVCQIFDIDTGALRKHVYKSATGEDFTPTKKEAVSSKPKERPSTITLVQGPVKPRTSSPLGMCIYDFYSVPSYL